VTTGPSSLHSTKLGEQGTWVVFCHGLFGQGKNWTQIAKIVAQRHRVLLLDMPQHGQSAWSPHFDYLDAADQVAAAISEAADGETVAVVGHSMGGKIAMALALRHPEQVERLCVVDVAPVAYPSGREFVGYVHAMRGLDLAVLATRADADAALADAVPNQVVRGFLLQNLRRSPDGQGWAWQPNLEVIEDDLDVITGWPGDRLSGLPPYDGRVLWVRGERSEHVGDEHGEDMSAMFPRLRRVTIKGAGHWVHSEQPESFLAVLQQFLGD
jgi:pimeloyl-ACP methyl ester carboxylesterase